MVQKSTEVPKVLIIIMIEEQSLLLQNTKKARIKVFFRNQHLAVVKIKISSRHHKFKKSEGGIGEVILAQLTDL